MQQPTLNQFQPIPVQSPPKLQKWLVPTLMTLAIILSLVLGGFIGAYLDRALYVSPVIPVEYCQSTGPSSGHYDLSNQTTSSYDYSGRTKDTYKLTCSYNPFDIQP